ncbi:uncharacterized protein LOC130685757 [Daphnia carinata]|uniref:uncharacterized protein LOC130685757 n=1 Tax=Daphnia carinata TaxID=120202 RepID=UPI00257B5EEF|nr:uncharacterized protein LOC130685757 [Daphnia carinata]
MCRECAVNVLIICCSCPAACPVPAQLRIVSKVSQTVLRGNFLQFTQAALINEFLNRSSGQLKAFAFSYHSFGKWLEGFKHARTIIFSGIVATNQNHQSAH